MFNLYSDMDVVYKSMLPFFCLYVSLAVFYKLKEFSFDVFVVTIVACWLIFHLIVFLAVL